MNKEIVPEDILGLSDPPASKRNFWSPKFATGPYPCDLREDPLGIWGPTKLEPKRAGEPGSTKPPEKPKRKVVYYSEIAKRRAEELEAAGDTQNPYYQELIRGRPSITDIWVDTRRWIEEHNKQVEKRA